MTKAIFTVISHEKRLAHFMKASDMLGHGKVMGNIQTMSLEYKEGVDVTFEMVAKNIYTLKDAVEQAGHLVTYVGLNRIEKEDVILLNNNKIDPFFNKQVRAISDGKNFFLMHEFLKKEKVAFETDEHYFITKIGKETKQDGKEKINS